MHTVDLALSLLDPDLHSAAAPKLTLSSSELSYHLGSYDLRRLSSYASNLVDVHLIMDLVPTLAHLRFSGKLTTPLSHVQAAILLAIGLQHQSVDEVAAALDLPASQLLALFNKAVRKMVGVLRALQEATEGEALPRQQEADAAGSSLVAVDEPLAAELDRGAARSLKTLAAEQAQKQAAWLSEVEDGSELARYAIKGSEEEWQAALGDGKVGAAPGHVSLQSSKAPDGAKHKKSGGEAKKGKRSHDAERGGGGSSHRSPKRRKS